VSDYEIDSKLKSLALVIDDHAEWFVRATKRMFFPLDFKGQEKLEIPGSFQDWLKEAEHYDFMDSVTLEDLKKLFEELHIVGKGITDKVMMTNELVTLSEFNNFTKLYESFVSKLRRLEHDCVMVDSGLDIDTALRSKSAMETDISRELERRARRGNPFTLALARIDNYDEFKNIIDKEQHKQMMATLGRLIKKCIRSFDDGYRSGDHEFIMSLKHAEAVGGTAAVNRLRSFLVEEKITIKAEDREIPLTMSYCVAEPVPGDTLDELLANMRRDLDKWDEDGDTALEYQEKSPLQRFIGDGE